MGNVRRRTFTPRNEKAQAGNSGFAPEPGTVRTMMCQERPVQR
jgi:hypothetical protein